MLTEHIFVQQLSFQKRPTDGHGEKEPPFFIPPPPQPRLPSVPISTKPKWRPKIPADVINNSLPAHQSKIQGGQGAIYSRDQLKGNQQRAMEHRKVRIQYLLHSTGCW